MEEEDEEGMEGDHGEGEEEDGWRTTDKAEKAQKTEPKTQHKGHAWG